MHKRLPMLALLATLAASGGLPSVAAETERPPEHTVRRATSEFRIDGVLDEQAWTGATRIDLPYEYQPGDNVEPPVRTEGLITFDSKNLYVAFRAHDPHPESIRAHLMDRDAISTFVQDDHVVLLVDPFDDERRAFQFRVNPLGVQADAIFSEIEGVEDFSWNIIWDSAGRITDFGYAVEIAIPLKQIRFPTTEGPQTWGIELSRSYPRNLRHRMASHRVDRDRTCILCQINKVTGFEDLERGRNLELDPTVTVIRTDEHPQETFPEGKLEQGDPDFEFGLSARWGITPSLTFNGTVNPDFSQVEADVAQLDVNERFALFFQETRPFFLEGIDFFATPTNAVFTRTVFDPEWGAKLTGKLGANVLGVFLTQDEVNNIVVPGRDFSRFASSSEGLLDPDVLGAVLRYRRDVGSNSTIGALYTGRESDGYHNRVGGFDGFFQLSRVDQLRAHLLWSDTRYPDSLTSAPGFEDQATGDFSGNSVLIDYVHAGRYWNWQTRYESLDSGFRADSGFIPRVDISTGEATFGRTWWGDDQRWFTNINLGGTALYGEDDEGTPTDRQYTLFSNFAGPLQSFLQLSLSRQDQRFLDVLHEDLDRAELVFNIQPGRVARLALNARIGDTVDFESNVPADLLEISPAAELKLGRHVNAQLSHTLRRIEPEEFPRLEANLSELRLFYHLNVRTFVRAIVQRQDVERQSDTDDAQLFGEFLFSYTVNPNTVFFLGYSEAREEGLDFDLTERSRTYFVKLGYAWLP